MEKQSILIIGGGIGGLTSAIALRRRGHTVTIIEKDPNWAVYGVGIIQQANVVRAMTELDLIDDYLDAGFGFDNVDLFTPAGTHAVTLTTPRLVDGLPANVGIGRRALHEVLGRRAKQAGAQVRLGVTATSLSDDGTAVTVVFSDGKVETYDIVIGADGLYSQTREQIFPQSTRPEFTGQSVWRYNFVRPDDMTSLWAFEGDIGLGMVPLAHDLMYMFITTPEPGNPRYPVAGLADAMRSKLKAAPPSIALFRDQITDDAGVVYKPLEWVLVEGDWHRGRVVLLGDAVHATTPHLGQGAGMAIEDSIVLADEISLHDTPEAAFTAFRARRFERCEYIVKSSLALCRSQLGQGPRIEQAGATRDMFHVVAQPI